MGALARGPLPGAAWIRQSLNQSKGNGVNRESWPAQKQLCIPCSHRVYNACTAVGLSSRQGQRWTLALLQNL